MVQSPQWGQPAWKLKAALKPAISILFQLEILCLGIVPAGITKFSNSGKGGSFYTNSSSLNLRLSVCVPGAPHPHGTLIPQHPKYVMARTWGPEFLYVMNFPTRPPQPAHCVPRATSLNLQSMFDPCQDPTATHHDHSGAAAPALNRR